MMRSREMKTMIIVLGSTLLFGLVITLYISKLAALILLLVGILFSGSFLYVMHWRYREIEHLSGYLRQILAGEYALDLRDNHEGELSILKSEIYKVTRMLSEQQVSLEKDKVFLKDAMSDISHQLKTPLASMTVMADLLEDPELPAEKRQEFVRRVQNQLERTEWLVSSLLKLSKIDAGTAYFKKDDVKVRGLIERALDPLLDSIDVKDINVNVSGDDAISFQGDLQWSTEALVNIMKNCVEHMPAGGRLHINFKENTLYTQMTIADTGYGIAKKDLPYIFKRFYKGKNAGDDSIGIGLAMAYTIVKEQNGSLDVKSGEGEGTAFTLKFYHPMSAD